jgi:hypothetical protein
MTKTLHPLFAAMAIATFVISPAANAQIVYQDNFDGIAGTTLNGRSPDVVNTTGNTWTGSTTLVTSGSGLAVSTLASGVLSIAMPTITLDDVITMTAVLRPRNTVNNFLAFGLSRSAGALSGEGTAWAFLRGGTHANGGMVVANSGSGSTGLLYQTPGDSLPQAGFEGINPSTMTLTYTVLTGNLKVQLGLNTVFEGLIDYGGVADTPAPLDTMTHFSLQWNSQLLDTNANPGYFDSVTVSVVPEPSTWALVAGSLTVLAVFRRRLGIR